MMSEHFMQTIAAMCQPPHEPAEQPLSTRAGKFATITASMVDTGAVAPDWYYTVISPEGALVASDGPYRSRGGAVAEAIARASALRLLVAHDSLALLAPQNEQAGRQPIHQVNEYNSTLTDNSLRSPAANEREQETARPRLCSSRNGART